MEQKVEEHKIVAIVASAIVAVIGLLAASVILEDLIIAQSTDPIATACALASSRESSQHCYVVLQRGGVK